MAVSPRRLRHIVVGCGFVAGFVLVIVRLVHLQVLQATELGMKADRQHQKNIVLEGARGTIYDRNSKVLAMNMDVPSVFGVPTSLGNPGQTARDLSPILHVKTTEIEKKLKQEKHFVWLARKLEPEQGRRLERLSLDGVGVVMEGRRFYPKGPLLSHVLGFAGMDDRGLEGVELRYEQYLRGEKRSVVLQRDALGRAVFPKGLNEEGAAAGHSLTLTVDEVIQYIAEKELDESVSRSNAKSGTIIVMDPKTGEVLAMAVSPRFDPNAVGALVPDRWRNRALTDTYEPGSTMKTVIAAAALEEKVMAPDSMINGENGRLSIANTVIHDHEKMGWMSFAQMIQKSSNIGAAKVGMALGEWRVFDYLKEFGFGEKSGIDLPGEASGLLRSPRQWGKRSVASISMGQEVGVTPLQMVTAISAIANGGVLMKPHIVSEIRNAKGQLVAQTLPQAKRRVISTETARTLTTLLEGVVTQGTGAKAAIPGYRVAGKTGTAQKVDPRTGAYSSTLLVGSFVGYVPAENPRLAMIVVIDEPRGEGWGGVVAAPVFRRVGEQVLNYLGVAVDEPIKLAMAGIES
ncbi:penicillin-binding protein 2 [Nitrospirales bacterium NOB]|nr:MAG: peptidoglycan glycosyltransferase [Nitrospira sp. OLB3]MBV6471091.1 Stage V sporulation protein D [Nitrospirota bacterium]MCE7966051.1 penicillin-binding protein 2 [Nitrospira sp. NTP2]MCK6493599.1 penicillin-binding protein 2 [Nitrospira sp.]MDL1889420.1 penicillin-binding protein 2 [Nitrospirales bacterium NOB]MEB2338995.1 penicillin-binding protein 2 [Nitrospirales bacterium]